MAPVPLRALEPRDVAVVPQSVWLVGMSGAGKSTVGPLLADRLGYVFFDLDQEIERLGGETIPELFRTGGEARFRGLEARATDRLASRREAVVATGGGWMARSDIARSAVGRVRLWLRVGPETAIHRLSEDGVAGRPMLTGPDPAADLAALLSRREGAYAEAELVVDTDELEPPEIVEAALTGLGRFGVVPVEQHTRTVEEGEIERYS